MYSDKLEKVAAYRSVDNYLLQNEEKQRAQIPLLSAIEQNQLATWNTTQRDYRRNICVQELIAQQAAKTPDAVAIVAGGHALSYSTLNIRANQLAHYLRRSGVGPNTLVGLCIERSLDMFVGLLGILKAGAAYLPLDSSYPDERLAFMMEDAHISLLVTQQRLTTRFTSQQIQTVCLDTDDLLLTKQSAEEPITGVKAVDLAYTIYTSGSTGRPKGVLITHGSLLNLISWHQDAFQVTASDRASQIASPAFDATAWELWPYLAIGASVYLVDETIRAVPAAIRDWLIHNDITITFLPTILAESIIALEWPSKTALRFLLTGADRLRHYPPPGLPFALINNYGPTEATVVTTSGQIHPRNLADTFPSLGRPIANTQIYVLDEKLRQVPIGISGELYIGGEGLAQGYLNRPELTAEKFIAHPFIDNPDARLYKTGDLVRYLPDGQIDFLGRIDHQIKIRGYRIEPGEIEAALNQHPAVSQSVVLAREDTPGEKRLIAYLVPRSNISISASSLRDALLTQLPDYMVPTVFVLLKALPVTPNGKVDNTALPAPSGTNTLYDGVASAPRTPIEERLVGIIAPLLGLAQIGIDDNVFMLGGHSLLGTQIVMRITATFGIDLPLRTLFGSPTVRTLADVIKQRILTRLQSMSDEDASDLLKRVNGS